MTRLVVCILALLVGGGLSEHAKKVLPQKIADQGFLQKQIDMMSLYQHVFEVPFTHKHENIVKSWDIEKHSADYNNMTAVKIYMDILKDNFLLPRGVPFSILNSDHRFEAETLFNVLFSAKNYDTFYKTAVYLKGHVNEGLFIYVVTTAFVHRPDTQGLYIPPIYEIFPSFFHNGQIMTTAQRLNTQGKHLIEHHPSTFMWNDDIVIRWNATSWPYFNRDVSLAYFTQDHELNAYYYNRHLSYPFWLGNESRPLVKDNRGELFWFVHKQLVARYYMERLSNDLGEIPVLGLDVVPEGYQSGLLYHSGIPFPVRPNHFHLDQPHFVEDLIKITDYERRIRDAIEAGYIHNEQGEHIKLHTPEAIDILGRIIEANVDSPNRHYFKDFISLWKSVLGNSIIDEHVVYHENHIPLVVPSTLEHYETAIRDPAFFMIWKRVLGLFTLWQKQLPLYKPEELALPSVVIQKVEVDRLVTFFEHTYVNVSNQLYMSEHERHGEYDEVSVLVQRPQLNHKIFQVRVNVKSDVAKNVTVRFFMAPKYDSYGNEIPLQYNTENFFLLDQFEYELPKGETVIRRDSTENLDAIDDWPSTFEVYEKALNSKQGKGQFVLDHSHIFNGFPQRFMLPKGRVGGMPFVFVVYISEFHKPKVPYGTNFDTALCLGLGTGGLRRTSDPLGYPFNRPIHMWQVKDLHNFWIQDVTVYHKQTPEIHIPYTK